MPDIHIQQNVNAPVEVVYATAKEIERFPEWMPDVESVEILSREGNRVTSRWVGKVQELRRTIKWTEEDVWDDAAHTCRFRTLEGDWDKYEGDWRFIPDGDGTRIELDLDFNVNVPLIGALIMGVVTKLMEKNSRGMLQALAEQSEKTVG